ncbi:MAG: hypothetical protein KKB74_11560 [Bacteroidetes bacterium]|nr:hypothetical protein [Bacteroidota bacterium]
MSTYVIKFNEKSKEAKYLLGLIQELAKNSNSISLEKILNKETLKSIGDAKNKKLFYAENVDELFNQLNE